MVPSDLLGITGVDDPRVAPDGESVVFVRSVMDAEGDRIVRNLWRVRPGAQPQPFTSGEADTAPRWSPDGRWIAFIRRTSDEERQVWLIAAGGGEARPLSEPFRRLGAPAWSPDSRAVAFTASAPFDGAHATVAYDEMSGARHAIAIPYKSDAQGLFDGLRMHVYVLPLDDAPGARRVAAGRFDALHPAWTPDGKRIVFVANPDAPEASFGSDLYSVARDGGAMTRLTAINGIFGPPAVSHDGAEIAVVAVDRDEFAGRRNPQLWCVPAGGGALRALCGRDWYLGDAILTDQRGHDAVAPAWMLGDGEIVVQRSLEGASGLVAFPRDGGAPREVVHGERTVYAFTAARDNTLAFAASEPANPGDVWLARDGGTVRLTDENARWLATHPLRVPRRIRPRASDGTVLDAWIVEAGGGEALPPMIHAIHGGPHGAYGFGFFFEFQMLASLGYTVVYGNPRGSQSYGEAYADAITGRWGELDAGDLRTIRDAAVEATRVDRARIGVQGGSYGGLMTTWLLGHDDGIYRAGVSMRAVNDYVSFAGASDIPTFLERALGADWDDGGQRLFELSPIRSAASIAVPLLIMHSDRDYRCPIDQGEQLFQRLRLLGKTAEFVRFTGDNHDLSRTGAPRNRLLRLRAIANWFAKFLRDSTLPSAPGWLFEPVAGEHEGVGSGVVA